VRLAGELGVLESGASLVYAGDDTTDEDAFRALRLEHPDAVTIHVGTGRLGDATVGQPESVTAAEFVLATPEALLIVLESLLRDRP
jgi:trehalose-6-phosphatase